MKKRGTVVFTYDDADTVEKDQYDFSSEENCATLRYVLGSQSTKSTKIESVQVEAVKSPAELAAEEVADALWASKVGLGKGGWAKVALPIIERYLNNAVSG